MRKALFLILLTSAPLVAVGACSEDFVPAAGDSGASATATQAPTTPPTSENPLPGSEDASKPDRSIAPDVRARIDAYDAALAKAVCGKLTTCCSDADIASYTSQFKEAPFKVTTDITVQNCETVVKQAFDALNVAKWGVSASVGNIVFDDAKGAACVAKMNATTCGLPLTAALFDGACFGVRGNEVFRKVGALGAACDDIGDTTFIGECDPALGYCNEQKRCTAWRKSGESCGLILKDAGPTERLFCAPGTNCDGQGIRTPGKCSAPPRNIALGDTCSASSGPDLVCPATAFCDLFGVGKCAEKKPAGAVCQYDEECVDGRPFSCFPAAESDAGAADASDGAPPTRFCGSTAFCAGRK